MNSLFVKRWFHLNAAIPFPQGIFTPKPLFLSLKEKDLLAKIAETGLVEEKTEKHLTKLLPEIISDFKASI